MIADRLSRARGTIHGQRDPHRGDRPGTTSSTASGTNHATWPTIRDARMPSTAGNHHHLAWLHLSGSPVERSRPRQSAGTVASGRAVPLARRRPLRHRRHRLVPRASAQDGL